MGEWICWVVSKPRNRRKSHPPEEQPPKLIDFGGLKGDSSSSSFLIWDPPNKETPPGGSCSRSNWGGYRGSEVLVIEIFVVETKRFVGSFVHVILTRQTCGQRSSRAAESKRRAIGIYFSERICYMFHISKCRGDRDLGLCTTSVLAFGEPQRNGKIRKKCFDV